MLSNKTHKLQLLVSIFSKTAISCFKQQKGFKKYNNYSNIHANIKKLSNSGLLFGSLCFTTKGVNVGGYYVDKK